VTGTSNSIGNLVKCWETYCARCGLNRTGLAYGGTTHQAASELRSLGWRTRGGFWACPECAPVLATAKRNQVR